MYACQRDKFVRLLHTLSTLKAPLLHCSAYDTYAPNSLRIGGRALVIPAQAAHSNVAEQVRDHIRRHGNWKRKGRSQEIADSPNSQFVFHCSLLSWLDLHFPNILTKHSQRSKGAKKQSTSQWSYKDKKEVCGIRDKVVLKTRDAVRWSWPSWWPCTAEGGDGGWRRVRSPAPRCSTNPAGPPTSSGRPSCSPRWGVSGAVFHLSPGRLRIRGGAGSFANSAFRRSTAAEWFEGW